MKAKLAIQTIAAFALALVVGRLVFLRGNSDAVGAAQTPVKSATVPAVAVSAAQDYSWLPQSKIVGRALNVEFNAVPSGLENDNGRMKTLVSTKFKDGIVHSAPHHFNQSVAWKPLSQEIRRGDQIQGVAGLAGDSKAYILNRDGQRHVVYPGTYANTDDRLYMRTDGGMEHDIILKKLPLVDEKSGLAFTGMLKLSSDLTMWDGNQQITGNHSTRSGINFKNSFGNTVFYLRPAFAYDANVSLAEGGLDKEKQAMPQNQQHLTGCEYQLSFEEEGIKLAVVTPGAWLNSPERTYPVVIDPNFGPFGLADGNPPIYTGSVGSDTFIPLHNGSPKVPTGDACTFLGFTNTQWGTVTVPFPFTFYGTTMPTGSPLYVHECGFASWTIPDPNPPPFLFPHRPCIDGPNAPIPDGAYPFDGFFPYWDDLQFSSDPLSGIYVLFDNTRGIGSGRLIMEWYKMGYFTGGTAADVISFNLVLYECNSIAEYIIKNPAQGEHDLGSATVGIENVDGSLGIQYCFNAAMSGQPEIPDSTALTFSVSPLSNLNVTTTPQVLSGCKPFTACYQATIVQTVPPCAIANGGSSIPVSFGFHWIFGDGQEGFTPNICHTFTSPGNFAVQLRITDSVGNFATFTNNLAVTVCDVPPIVITADPQGGTAPLTVNIFAKSVSPHVLVNGSVVDSITQLTPQNIVVDQLGTQNEPFQFVNYATIAGDTATVLFDHPGTYRVQATFTGTSLGLPTTGTGTIFINVQDPNSPIFNSLLITESNFKINWAGKLPNQQGVPVAPASDTISLKGFINLQGLELSQLAGETVTIALNAYDPIFEGVLDSKGHAIEGDFTTGKTGTFDIAPSGAFTCSVKGDFAFSLGLVSLTERKLLTEHYRIQIGNVFNSPGTTVTYDYKSNASKQASGHYKFGQLAKFGLIPGAPGGFGEPGGQTVLLSGGFVVTSADFKLEGDTVTAKIGGLLARAGGDDLRPAATSDVVIKIGSYTETLNFSLTPKFKTTGRAPAQKFAFKSSGGTNIKSLGWANKAGNFQIATFSALPNSQVGINPGLAKQPITIQFIVSPENGQQYVGTTTFDIFKVSDTEFKH